jgi:thiol:disulfide interchange protein DsbD
MVRRGTRCRALAALAFVTVAGMATSAAAQNPVNWTASSKTTKVEPGTAFEVELVARMDPGWHIYSIDQAGPPVATSISVPAGQPFVVSGRIVAPAARIAFDQGFNIDTSLYEGSATFSVPIEATADAQPGSQMARVQARYQACNNQLCLPPKTATLEVAVEVTSTAGRAAEPPASPAAGAPEKKTDAPPTKPTTADAGSSAAAAPPAATTPPVSGATAPPAGQAVPPAEVKPATAASRPVGGQSLWSFLWLAMSVGALSLLTPCVFPMVPITVSYFTGHAAGSRMKALQQAATYMIGIILTFTALGMALALLVGATSLNRFAANPWVNILITAIFVGFALSLFGVFDLAIPPSIVNRLDGLTRRQGGSQTIATLLMGLTFTLTSFTCTAPFVGTLLVMAAGGDWQWPLVGMLAFSTVFALPFFILALMPQWMSRLPRSGGWLNSVKVMMAFLEIAAAMKFISNVDLVWGWGIFTRDVVLASWVVIGVLMALYVIGLFRFKHEAPVAHVGLVRLASAILCGTVALWLLTGLFGKRLGEIEAFLPPAPEAIVDAAGQPGGELPWIMNDYQQALARAKQEQKLVFIDFTGYTCTNCRWMEANMFTRPEVQHELRRYVLVRLYTDGEGEMFERQQHLQQAMYRTVALPFYAVVDPSGQPVVDFPGLTRDPAEFVEFLKQAQGRTPAAVHAIDR